MTSTDLSALRDLRHKVREAYASVQHTLTVDQRRDMRTRIATLSSLVREAENRQQPDLGTALLASVAHATEHAPALAHLALARIPRRKPGAPKKSAFTSFVNAFRLME